MKTATTPDQTAPTRERTRRATPKKQRTRGTDVVRARDQDGQGPTPAPDDDELVLEALDEDALDPDALEEVADLERVAGVPDLAGVEDPVDGAVPTEEVATTEGEDEEEDDVEPDLGALLTGLLVPEPEAGVDDDEDRGVSSLEIEYVPTARGNEFVCSACFLIWNRRHLANVERKVCRDCIDDVVPAPRRVAAA